MTDEKKIVIVTVTPHPPPTEIIVETEIVEREGDFWFDVYANRMLYDTIGPFETEGEAKRAATYFADMNRQLGAVDLPTREQ